MNVKVIKLSSENYDLEKAKLFDALEEATFIAIDCEMTGLGFRNIQTSLDERFRIMKNAVTERALLSLGIACFQFSEQHGSKLSFKVQAFDVLLKCRGRFMSDTSALDYLLCHGFDFNKQLKSGLEYFKGDQRETDSILKKFPGREVFMRMLSASKPVIVHNGLFDLMYLHHCLYASIPDTIGGFFANLSEMFTEGIYDTKYMSERDRPSSQTVLSTLFEECAVATIDKERLVGTRFPVDSRWCEEVTTPKPTPWVDFPSNSNVTKCFDELDKLGNSVICPKLINRLCRNEETCLRSHKLDNRVLTHRRGGRHGGRGRQQQFSHREVAHVGQDQHKGSDQEIKSIPNPRMIPQISSAAVDAFMTGYVFATYAAKSHGFVKGNLSAKNMSSSRNRVFLRVNDKLIYVPLAKSEYCATTEGHRKQKLILESLAEE